MSNFINIGIAGQARNGKNEVANILNSKLGPTFHQVGFADKIKEVFQTLFNVNRAFIEHWKVIPTPPPGFQKSVRECLIDIGDNFRNMKSDIWIRPVLDNQQTDQIITDVRYDNELIEIRENGIIILVARPNHTTTLRGEQDLIKYIEPLVKSNTTVVPEDSGVPVDFFILNNGSLDDLTQSIENLLPHIRQKLTHKIRNKKHF